MRGPGFFEGVCAGVFAMVVLGVCVQLADAGAVTNLEHSVSGSGAADVRPAGSRCLWPEIGELMESAVRDGRVAGREAEQLLVTARRDRAQSC